MKTAKNLSIVSKKPTFDCIHHTNITEDHLNAYGLHINGYGTRVLAKTLISGAQAIRREKDSLIKVGKLKYRKSKFTSVSVEDKVEDSCNNFLTDLNTEPCEITADNETDINLVLRKLPVSYPNNVIQCHHRSLNLYLGGGWELNYPTPVGFPLMT